MTSKMFGGRLYKRYNDGNSYLVITFKKLFTFDDQQNI